MSHLKWTLLVLISWPLSYIGLHTCMVCVCVCVCVCVTWFVKRDHFCLKNLKTHAVHSHIFSLRCLLNYISIWKKIDNLNRKVSRQPFKQNYSFYINVLLEVVSYWKSGHTHTHIYDLKWSLNMSAKEFRLFGTGWPYTITN